jgi:hypothetical protein
MVVFIDATYQPGGTETVSDTAILEETPGLFPEWWKPPCVADYVAATSPRSGGTGEWSTALTDNRQHRRPATGDWRLATVGLLA